ncbi:MAG: alpha/beta fold hydrolase [Caulobacteraceae bacterium]
MGNGTIETKSIKTERINMSYLTAGDVDKQPLVLVHGNVSSSYFWMETIAALKSEYRLLAPDMRGYGNTEALPIDATRGVRDWSDDLKSFIDALSIKKPFPIVGWSLGGGIIMQYAIDHPEDISALILINSVSPYGFGSTKSVDGIPCNTSFSGAGAGSVNPEFLKLIKDGDEGEGSPNSPRNVMNQFYFKPPFKVGKEIEDMFVKSMISTKVGEGFYPGDFSACSEWPGVAPGKGGINNAMSPNYMNTAAIVDIAKKVPILWVRGENDMIVSDQSFFDFGFLGKSGFVPGWPGDDVYPPQPMVSQTRYVLEMYKEKGGYYEEFVVKDSGHSPHIEKPEIFQNKLRSFLKNIH